MFFLRFIFSFLAICATLLFVTGVISAIINPQLELDSNGEPTEKNRNARIVFGLLTALFWSLLIAL
jgi:hypothetical protein